MTHPCPNEKLSQLLSLARQENHVTAWGKLVNKHKKAILVPDASFPISRPTEKLSHSCSSQLGVNYATTTNTNIEIPPEQIKKNGGEIPNSRVGEIQSEGAGAVLLWWFNMIICRGHFPFTSIRHLHQRAKLTLSQQIQTQILRKF